MKQLTVGPVIHKFPTVAEFAKEFNLGPDDLLVTMDVMHDTFFAGITNGAHVITVDKLSLIHI